MVQQVLHMPLAEFAESMTSNNVQADERLHFTEHQHCTISQLPAVHDVQM